ncbi:hypothetical protein ACN92M_17090 [Paenibacillus polymyxa]|uniref:hypothetical protein n=1 Tax=Paenibacillus polymyxa TaxID=1406 RepID=UPI003B5999F5
MRISFDMHLPFKFPIKDGLKSIHAYDNAEFMLTYHSYKRSIIIDEEYLLDEIDCSCITVNFLPHESMIRDLKKDEILRLTVLNSLDFLNRFIDALRVSYGLSHTHNITINDLPVCLTLAIDEEEYYEYLTRPHDVIPPYKELNLEELSKVGSSLQLWDTNPEIFLFEKFFATARSHLRKEQMVEAIIDLQTSFEIFIRNTHKLLLLHNGASQSEIEKASSISFRNVVEDHIGRILSANLKFNESSGPIHEWFENLYKVRNEIVHNGRVYVSGDEGYKAYDAYVNARNYIADLLDDAGMMTESKKVDLNIFPKNTKGVIDSRPVIERLKDQGMIPEDLMLYDSSQEKSEEGN